MNRLATGLGGAAIVGGLFLWHERRSAKAPRLPAWVAEARERGQHRYEARKALMDSPITNGMLAPVLEPLWRRAPRTPLSLPWALRILSGEVSEDNEPVVTDESFSSATILLERLWPQLRAALRCPAFDSHEIEWGRKIPKKPSSGIWVRELTRALTNYAAFLSGEERLPEAREVILALLVWTTNARQANSHLDRTLVGGVAIWLLDAMLDEGGLSAFNHPEEQRLLASALREAAPATNAFAQELELQMVENPARLERQLRQSNFRYSLVRRLFRRDEIWRQKEAVALARELQRSEPELYPSLPLELNFQHFLYEQGLQNTETRLEFFRAAYLALACTLELLAHRQTHGHFPDRLGPEACLPTATYDCGGLSFILEVPLPKTRAWAEADQLYSHRFADTLLRYDQGSLVITLDDFEELND